MCPDECVPGCTDETACNFNTDAEIDDGSCLDISEVTANTAIIVDCAGTCASAIYLQVADGTCDDGVESIYDFISCPDFDCDGNDCDMTYNEQTGQCEYNEYCEDPQACNLGAAGACEYPDAWCDCSGEILEGYSVDCVGTIFLDAFLSWIQDGWCDDGTYGLDLQCCAFNFDGGDCGDPMGCDGLAEECGGAVVDECGECGGDGSTCADCGDEPGLFVDCSGSCEDTVYYANWLGDGICDDGSWGVDLTCFSCDEGDCEQITDASDSCYVCDTEDCVGTCMDGFGGWVGDGHCDDGTWGFYFDCDMFECDGGDCFDECNVCSGDGIQPGACDCAGNTTDECGVCGGDNTSCADCLGEPNGSGLYDCNGQCIEGVYQSWLGDGYCDDGTWGVWFDCDDFQCDEGDCIDECGECSGGNLACQDCCGVAFGDNDCLVAGDIDGNGVVQVNDIIAVVSALLGDSAPLEPCAVLAGDVMGDGEVNVLDVVDMVFLILNSP